jgi:hypothetical protein
MKVISSIDHAIEGNNIIVASLILYLKFERKFARLATVFAARSGELLLSGSRQMSGFSKCIYQQSGMAGVFK